MLKLADTSLIFINPSPSNVNFLTHFSQRFIIYIVEWLVLYTIYVLNKEI